MNRTHLFHKSRAFTLIELLIVVAIMAILCASMIAYITVPPQEERRATADMEAEAGLSGLFAKLAGDAHNAARLTVAPDGRAVLLEDTGQGESTVYFVDSKDRLRRAVIATVQAGAWLKGGNALKDLKNSGLAVASVSGLDATPVEGGRMWRIRVIVQNNDPLHPTVERGVELAVGLGGGAQAQGETGLAEKTTADGKL